VAITALWRRSCHAQSCASAGSSLDTSSSLLSPPQPYPSCTSTIHTGQPFVDHLPRHGHPHRRLRPTTRGSPHHPRHFGSRGGTHRRRPLQTGLLPFLQAQRDQIRRTSNRAHGYRRTFGAYRVWHGVAPLERGD
jgi:hypothetical protein